MRKFPSDPTVLLTCFSVLGVAALLSATGYSSAQSRRGEMPTGSYNGYTWSGPQAGPTAQGTPMWRHRDFQAVYE